MKERIEIQDVFTIEDCNANPNKYYVYGDNLVHQGYGGQATIRDCKNAIGIPTKRLPSMDNDAFFSDQQEEMNRVQMFLARLLILYNSKEKPIIVFPSAGLGTGRAELFRRSPRIYKMINTFLKNEFGIEMVTIASLEDKFVLESN